MRRQIMTTDGIGGYSPQFVPTGNPEADAMRYAQANGISLEEAKNQLRSQFGDPQAQGVQGPSILMPQSQLLQMQAINMPPGSSLFNFNTSQSNQTPTPQTPEQMIGLRYGIPPEIIAKGDDAIRKYAEDNNISLPAKNDNNATSSETESTASTSKTNNTTATTTTSATTSTAQNNEDVAENGQMSRKEAKAWVKAYRKEHNCSKKEAKAAFEKEFGYEYPKANTKWIGAAGLGVFIAGIASLAIFGGGSSSGSSKAPQPWEFGGKNHFS